MMEIEPLVGEVWTTLAGRRELLILGNCIRDDQTIWCLDLKSRVHHHAPLSQLKFRERRSLEAALEVCQKLAREGDADAAWWCGWYHEGSNHPKSVWYTLAALRLSRARYGWAFNRIYGDAHDPGLCRDVPPPDLAFLDEITEFRQVAEGATSLTEIHWGEWQEAIRCAEAAVHLAAKPQPLPQVKEMVATAESGEPGRRLNNYEAYLCERAELESQAQMLGRKLFVAYAGGKRIAEAETDAQLLEMIEERLGHEEILIQEVPETEVHINLPFTVL